MKRKPGVLKIALLLGALLSGCQSPRQSLEALGSEHGQHVEIIVTQAFPLILSTPLKRPDTRRIRLYLEGDGHAWATASQPSLDPSPQQLLIAGMAFNDPTPSLYLARPCQFVSAPGCVPALWTARRFSPEVLDSLDQALNQIKSRYGNQDFELIGYSGGAALALLLAARRDDIAQVQTLAGNLSPRLWAERLNLSPLTGSLEPLDNRARLAHVRQRHLVGADDSIVPPALVDSYRRALGRADCLEVVVLPGVSHAEGLDKVWGDWRDRPIQCAGAR
ncbi:alpha/beta hydrolase [Pseudomonas brassicacearum]|uniref:Alpha/beta hydrolase n=1 Tax=Pseudomonas brassicacearum TaxID=930166 RepID=A0A423GS04_9PSED|nr:alpha/beta hydrolase [Pseudomonas brassicacearum]ROM97286.1 alpha/beta hydrolase [Pseudomonas brassicacearum]